MTAVRLRKLECVRGFAAIYVVCYHIAHFSASRKGIWSVFLFGPEAVTLFFLLSGFVIFYSTQIHPLDLLPRNYAVKRFRRIYPIFLVALAMGYLSHAVTIGHWGAPSWRLLAGNLLMLQDYAVKPGVWFDTFYNNGPLWSLSYECWFYVLFIIVVRQVRDPRQQKYCAAGVSLAGIVSYLLIPNQVSLFLMYFMIWWCGVELAREFAATGRMTWRRQIVPVGMLASLSLLWLWPLALAMHHHELLIMNAYPMLIIRNIFAALLLIVLGVSWHKLRFVGFDQLLGGFVVFAPMSYAIYVVHFPIISALQSVDPGKHELLKAAIALTGTLLVAYVLEERLQPLINGWSKRFLVGGKRGNSVRLKAPSQEISLKQPSIVR